MKALIFQAPDKPVVADVDMPAIAPTEVLVKTRAVGICHSDYELWPGATSSRSPIPSRRATNGPARSSRSAAT